MNFCFHMTDDQSKLLVDLEVRIKQVMLLCDSLKEENGRLKSDLRSKQSQLDQTGEELQQLKSRKMHKFKKMLILDKICNGR